MVGMKYRKLRIAVSILCTVPCVLLTILWVRSHFRNDRFYLFDIVPAGDVLVFDSDLGALSIGYFKERGGVITRFAWRFETSDMNYGPDSYPLFFQWMDMYNTLVIRLWFLVFLSGIFAALSWRYPPTRFSLRTLLIGMTVIAGILGLAVWVLRTN
jgi:hypothetical protein